MGGGRGAGGGDEVDEDGGWWIEDGGGGSARYRGEAAGGKILRSLKLPQDDVVWNCLRIEDLMRLICMLVLVGVCGGAWAEDNAVVARPAIVSAEEWGSKPEAIPAERKHVPKYITIHHAGVVYKAGTDPAKSECSGGCR